MMLGKRQRPPMKRTTSMSEITFDLNTPTTDVNNPSWWKQQPVPPHHAAPAPPLPIGLLDQSRLLATVSPRNNHRKQFSADMDHHTTTADFLRSCSLCKRRLVTGRDIYMYKGDSAFCSLECRQQQMNKDERKDKCFVASKKQAVAPPPPPSSSSGSQVAT